MADDKVCLAYVHENQVAHSWHHSMLNLIAHDSRGGGHLGGITASRYGTGGLVEARNLTIDTFLDRDADWLLWTDTDMGFAADSLDRLMAAADATERPIVGGLCFSWQEYEEDGMGGWRTKPLPTLFQWAKTVDAKKGLAPWLDFPPDEVVQVAATGSAFILIHRDVFLKMGEEYGAQWYSRIHSPGNGQLLGEDLSFCVKAAAIGFPVHVHTGVKTSHQKTVWVTEEHYAASGALND
jgi:hypothetical protein